MKQFRITEIFGPTIQGEGRHVGIPAYFIRFAGCDFRCVWCDSPRAVLPEYVKYMPRMSEEDILVKLRRLHAGPKWVVLSGGNPALFDLRMLVAMLQDDGFKVMVETQGSVWKDWLTYVDEVCFSPKPPSAGETWSDPEDVDAFISHIERRSPSPTEHMYLKIVVFDDLDYAYARSIHKMFPQYETFLSVGNADPWLPTVSNPTPDMPELREEEALERTQRAVLEKMTWLMEKLSEDEEMHSVRILPQMHVLAWGNTRGR